MSNGESLAVAKQMQRASMVLEAVKVAEAFTEWCTLQAHIKPLHLPFPRKDCAEQN